jgi:hypothetical protein
MHPVAGSTGACDKKRSELQADSSLLHSLTIRCPVWNRLLAKAQRRGAVSSSLLVRSFTYTGSSAAVGQASSLPLLAVVLVSAA